MIALMVAKLCYATKDEKRPVLDRVKGGYEVNCDTLGLFVLHRPVMR